MVPRGARTAMPLAWVINGSGIDWSLMTPWYMKFFTLYAALRISSLSVNEYGELRNRFGPASLMSFCCTALLIVSPESSKDHRSKVLDSLSLTIHTQKRKSERTKFRLHRQQQIVAVVADALRVVTVHRKILTLGVRQDLIFANETSVRCAHLTEHMTAVSIATCNTSQSSVFIRRNAICASWSTDTTIAAMVNEPAVVFATHPVEEQLASKAEAHFGVGDPAHRRGHRRGGRSRDRRVCGRDRRRWCWRGLLRLVMHHRAASKRLVS